MEKINFNQLSMNWRGQKKSVGNSRKPAEKCISFFRHAAILIMLLALGVGQMWGWGFSGDNFIYFHNKGGWSDSGKMLFIGKSSYTSVYTMSAVTGNSSLWVVKLSNAGWSDATYMAVAGGGSVWGSGSWGPSNRTNATHYTNTYTSGLDASNNQRYILIPASSSNNANLSLTYLGSDEPNYTITVKAKISTDGGSTYSEATSPGTLSASSKKFTAYNSCNSSTSLSSGKITCGYLYSTTLTAAAATGYDFVGWYNSSGTRQTTETTLTINPTADATYYAYYKEKRYNVTAAASPAAGGSVTPTSATAMGQITGGSITATPNTGYTFGGWSITSGSGSFSSSTSTASNTFKPTAASTVTATFNETMSTVSFVASPTGKGTFTVGGSTVASTTAGITTTKSVTAVPATGYAFASWAITGGATISSTSTNPTTVTGKGAGAAATLTCTFNPKNYSITLDGNGGSDGSATATYNSSTLTSVTGCSRPSYDLNGYFTATSGGTKVINANGTLVANVSGYTNSSSQWIMDDNVELHAQWTYNPVTYSVTYAVGTGYTSYGSLSAKNSSTSTVIASGSSVESGTGITFTATPNTGYVVEGWYTDAACTAGKHDEGSTTYTIASLSSAVTVYVKFVEKTWSVAFAAGTGGTVTTPASTPKTVGQVTGISIAATPATGYTFNSWSSSSGGSFTSGTSTNSNTFKPTANTTVTASFNETKSTITVTTATSSQGTLKFGSTSKSWGATASLGVATTQEITATAAAGFTFVRWDLSGAAASASTLTNATITLKANGSGSTGTATAVFEEDLSSRWHLVGNSSDFPDGWNVNNTTMMQKKTGHSTESAVYFTVNVTSTDTKEFKVVDDNGASSDIWYGYSTGSTYLTWTATSTKNVYTGDGNGNNLKYTPTVTGPYEFKVDYSGTYPAVTITYPTSYTLTYDIGTVKGTSGSISTSPTTASGSKVLSGNTVTLTAPAAKTGYTWKGWYTNAAGTEGKIPDTDRAITVTMNANKTLYACYSINNHAITHSDASHGSYTIKVGDASAVSTNTTSDYGKTITLAATPATGYHFGSWSAYKTGTPATTVTVTSNQFTMPDYAVTVGATFTPNTYRVHFHRNGGAGETVYQNFTYDVAQNLTANSYTRTGYTFAGWALSTGGDVEYANSANVSNLTAENGVDFHLYAKWTPKTTAITLDQTGAASSGSVTTRTGTYNADMPAITGSGSLPTAPQGYAFMGYYDALEPLGTKYYNADGTSAHTWNKENASFTLHAYFKQAEITGITFSPGTVVENNSTVNVTAVISPEPTGTTTVCWRILYDNGSALDPQPTFTPATRQGTEVSFIAPNASGMYKAEAVLHLGSGCGGSDISTYEANFQVAGSHNVTVAYKQGSTTIKASTIVTGRPLDWSDPITAPEIFGYTFDHWTAGDGITLSANGSTPVGSDESSANPIYITAIYNGTLTANYTPKNIVYFKDNLGWTDPEDADAHIYVNLLQSDYWNNDRGSGNYNRPNRNLQMDRVPGTTDIFYYDYGNKTTSNYISFTKESMGNSGDFYQTAPDYAHVVFPSRTLDALGSNNATGLGFYAATPMFVPLATQTPVKKNSDRAAYYNDGYWTKYLPGTGYTLQIYNSAGNSLVKEVAFTSADELMPMKVVTDLEGNHTYKFQLKRDGDVYYGNNGTMTYADHGQNTAWDFFNNSPFNMCTIVTTAAGDYTFNLSYSPNSGGTNNRLRISVDYPVSDGDYRLVYKDDVHTKMHPSAIVNKVNDGTDIVSFFVRKDENPKLYIQQATVNPSTGAITWNEYPNSGTPTNQITGAIASAITTDTVYNFNLSMNGSGALTVASAEYYSGNYYIRTDAANSKWDNYRTDPDHLMTYSDYLKTDVGYSHYYTHWVRYTDTGRKNVKFVIANDYSPCISDTLAREDATGTWANIATFMEEGGDLKRSANVRFMWDIKTNAIARAYIDGAQEDGTHFLELLSADGKIKNTAETETLTAVTFSDNGNWIYEANIKAQPNAQIKLKSTWGEGTTIVQYFKGAADETEPLIGGSGGNWYPIRVLYDFKTNRLVAAYVPTTGTYNTEDPINADVMFIREHQGDIAQLTFGGSGAISEIKTAYGVLRLNKWTINNKSKEAGHAPLSPELSRYERDLFYISFPFRVNLEEVFGFGTYGTHWIVEEYDGAGRAANGFWKDTPTFWRFITNRKGKFLEPNIGYIVALDLDELGETSSVWANTDQVELYFPSYGSMPDIKSSSVTHEVPAHTCTINRPTPKGDRRVADSHWNVMSVPTYINTNNVSFANTDWITTATETSVGPTFLYTVNWNDNSLTATNGVGYTYRAMHAYIVQYCGNVTWTTSVSPALAPRRNPDAPKDAEFCIELQQNEAMIDRTFVRLTDDEAVTSGFEFNYDMSKEFNKNKANIYTMVTTIMEDGPSVTETAGNCLPLTDQTTIVPMGVQIATNGDYTFSIPSGTNGVGVTLVDNETGIRTNLALMDYTIALEAGTQDDRFYLEISPIKHVATDIENTDAGDHVSNVRKMMVDGLLYIIKDGKVFDAHGARVK